VDVRAGNQRILTLRYERLLDLWFHRIQFDLCYNNTLEIKPTMERPVFHVSARVLSAVLGGGIVLYVLLCKC